MQLTQPVCRHPVSSATKHARARPRLRRAAAAPSWRAHSGPWRAGTRQPAPSALRPDALRAAGHTARQRKSSTHMYVGFSVLAAGAKLPSISAPQLPGRQEESGRAWCSFCASQSGNQPHPKMAPGLEGVRTAARRTMQSLQSVRQRALSTSVPASMSTRRSGVTGAAAGIAVLGGGFLAAFKWLQGPASAELAPENVAVVTSQEQLDEVRLCAIVRAQARARNAPRADLPPRPDPHTALQRRHPKCNVCCGRVGRLRFPLALCVCCHNACSLLAPARLLTCPRPRRRSWLHLRDAGAGAQAVWQRCVAKGGAPAAVSVHHQRQCRRIRRAG